MSKHDYTTPQPRRATGEFTTKQRVATNRELQEAAARQAKADREKVQEMVAMGLREYDYSEIFCA